MQTVPMCRLLLTATTLANAKKTDDTRWHFASGLDTKQGDKG